MGINSTSQSIIISKKEEKSEFFFFLKNKTKASDKTLTGKRFFTFFFLHLTAKPDQFSKLQW
jgi:hypothetical protein